MSESTLRIGVLMSEVLGTYRDMSNAIVLKERARRRGIAAEAIKIGLLDAIPESLDIYAPGDSEDTAQSLAVQELCEDPGLMRALDARHPLLAICTSLQVLGYWYRDARDQRVAGLGVLDITIGPQGLYSIGELVSEPVLESLAGALTGSENHGGGTILDPETKPLGRVVKGTGNGTPEGCESAPIAYNGVVQESIIVTCMHGPCLAHSPELADPLISRAAGLELEPLKVPGVGVLHAKRLGTLGVQEVFSCSRAAHSQSGSYNFCVFAGGSCTIRVSRQLVHQTCSIRRHVSTQASTPRGLARDDDEGYKLLALVSSGTNTPRGADTGLHLLAWGFTLRGVREESGKTLRTQALLFGNLKILNTIWRSHGITDE